jgi:hypothetical protein
MLQLQFTKRHRKPPTHQGKGHPRKHLAAIVVGGVIGAVAAVLLLTIAVLALRRTLRRRKAAKGRAIPFVGGNADDKVNLHDGTGNGTHLGNIPAYEDITHSESGLASTDVTHGGDVPPPDYRAVPSTVTDRMHDPVRSLHVVGPGGMESAYPRESVAPADKKRIRALPPVPPSARITNPPLSYLSMSSSLGSQTHVGSSSPVRDAALAWKGQSPSAKEDRA